MNLKKKVFCYVALSDDILTKSNIEIIKKSSKYGSVIIGLMSDDAINEYKSAPLLNFDQRKLIAENLKNVHKVVEQKTRDYTDNLIKYKPKYVIHKKKSLEQGSSKKNKR
jgi:glycerol-3-phosphate cytidylyltransferase-like family protein